jgi:hypothetical protein
LTTSQVQLVHLGDLAPPARAAWETSLPGLAIKELKPVSPSGRRFGSRVLGIGLDSFRAGLKSDRSLQTIADNPWPALALKLLGTKDLAVTGIYSTPGSRSWRLLRTGLRDSPVVTTSNSEAVAWRADGGNAASVLWGGTFGVSSENDRPADRPRIFVGGTSDRDAELVRELIREVQVDRETVDVVVADGSGPQTWAGRRSAVQWLPYVSQSRFTTELAQSSVSFLPLVESGRASGHMVLVGSLQAGIPTLATRTSSLEGYDSNGLFNVRADTSILRQLLELAERGDETRSLIRADWSERFSAEAYTKRVVKALTHLGWL